MNARTETTFAFATGHGQSDTHAVTLSDGRANPSKSAGQPYDLIDGKQIVAMIKNPPSVPKEQARWFIPSTYHNHDARSHEAHGNSRFELIRSQDQDMPDQTMDSRVINRAGFVRVSGDDREYIFFPEAWKEVCAGMDPGAVAKVLAERGFMLKGGDGKPQVKQRLPGIPNPARCYVVSSSILAED